MRAKDFVMRGEITIAAGGTVDESIIPFVEPCTGGLPIENDKKHLADLVRDLNIGTRQSLAWPIGQRNRNRALTLPGDMRTGEGR
jgi:hypothetical protein